MKKRLLSAIAVVAVVAWILLFVNSFVRFEQRVSSQAEAWHLSWADRR